MNHSFPRLITLLRKEQGISQKSAADQLGISQALLSHYENGVRECGLDFVVRIADFYNVSTDYLLGRTPHRHLRPTRTSASAVAAAQAGGHQRILDSLSVTYDLLEKLKNRQAAQEATQFLSYAVYRVLRKTARVFPDTAPTLFSFSNAMGCAMADAAMTVSEVNLSNTIRSASAESEDLFSLSPESLKERYPTHAAGLLHLIVTTEASFPQRRKEKLSADGDE